MVNECGFNFGRGNPVARHIHHIVDSTKKPDIAVVVDFRAITGEITSRVFGPISFFITIRITPDSAKHCRPRFGNSQIAAALFDLVPFVVYNFYDNAGNCMGS